MRITDKQLDRFIELYQKHFDIVLDRKSACKKGSKLAEVLQLILEDNYKRNEKRNTN